MSVHDHHRATSSGQRELLIALLLTTAMMVIEAVAGWTSGSLALLADAGHMLTDAAALALSFFAAWIAAKPATNEKTYGYYRTEILVALANGFALWLMVLWIYWRALHRLHHPLAVHSGPMIAVATLGLLVNLLSGRILLHQRDANLNIRSAWLNVMSDALGSVGVIVAGFVIRGYGWTAADPIASMGIGILIAVNSWNLVKQSVNILLEGSPHHLQVPDVVQAIQALSGVVAVHDVHLWTITTGMDAMSGHVVVEDLADSAGLLERLNALLSARFNMTHTTLQLEPPSHRCHMGPDRGGHAAS